MDENFELRKRISEEIRAGIANIVYRLNHSDGKSISGSQVIREYLGIMEAFGLYPELNQFVSVHIQKAPYPPTDESENHWMWTSTYDIPGQFATVLINEYRFFGPSEHDKEIANYCISKVSNEHTLYTQLYNVLNKKPLLS